ncbi:ionotropic glutamate receptor, metazoa [Artemisia annua]|uniref:Ionotropic glutamate receptor, metazoa n=1 Tax=Artemisia annua TaxID=35608 RepID=A0A2U1M9S4_ARTAN|nr:ionotropic glutamate receptor, metazoa [Artemisia annua]
MGCRRETLNTNSRTVCLSIKGWNRGVYGDSFVAGVTVSNLNFEDYRRKPYYSYDDYAKALSGGGADAIIDEVPYVKMFLGKYSTDYAMILSEPTTSGFAFIFQKGSPLVTQMFRQIAKIREDGTLRLLEKKWFEKHSSSSQDPPRKPKTLNFGMFRAADLLENLKVQAIVGPETSVEAKFLSVLGKKTKVPIFSLATNPSFLSATHPYFFQMTQDETIQWNGLAAIVESFKWTNVILVHEDNEFGRESVSFMMDSFHTKSIHVSYKSAISPSAKDDQILDELHKLSNLQETIFIIHISPTLAFRILVYAKRLGLMSQGYAWIVTDKTMNFFDPVELDEEVLESFQGVIGLRYHIPSTTQFRNFYRRLRKNYPFNNPNIYNVLSYDAICALATAVEREESRKFVFQALLNVTYKGLSGEFHLVSKKYVAKPLEIVNVIGKGERRVGFWTEDDGITMHIKHKLDHRHSFSVNGLQDIFWPGGSMIPPRRRILQKSKKLRIGVPMLAGFNEFLSVVHDPQTNVVTPTGFCIDVFKSALDALPYDVPYEFVPFEAANERPTSEDYNQLIYEVYLENYDAVVGDTTITANRSLYVDFTIPYTDLGVGTIAKKDNHRNMWWFMEPLDTRMWVTTTFSFFVIGATIWVIEYPTNKEFQGPWHRVVGNVLWFSFSTLTFSHRAKLLSNLSRLLVIVWLFILFVMITCYNAALSSMLTVQQIQLTRRGLDIGYHAGSFIEGVIINNSDFKNPSLKPFNSLDQYANALSGGSKKGGAVAIMDEFPYIKLFLAKYGDAYDLVSYEPNTNGFGFVFPKGSPLVPDISREIAKLREDGEILKLEKKWFRKDSSFMPKDSQEANLTILTLYNFRGLFMIGGLFLALVPLVFLICYVYEHSFLVYYILMINPRFVLELLHSVLMRTRLMN